MTNEKVFGVDQRFGEVVCVWCAARFRNIRSTTPAVVSIRTHAPTGDLELCGRHADQLIAELQRHR